MLNLLSNPTEFKNAVMDAIEDKINEVKKKEHLKGSERRDAKVARRKDRVKIKKQKKKFKRSATGKSLARKSKKMSKLGRTSTGKKKTTFRTK